MPELPEVETVLRGIKPFVSGEKIKNVVVRRPTLRWPIPQDLPELLKNKALMHLKRRGKYLIFTFSSGELILHLGMSGRLRVLKKMLPPEKHDHVDFMFKNGVCLRFTDPRRFGALLWSKQADAHPLISHMGVEPLTAAFSATYLFQTTRHKKTAIKLFLMNGKYVVGIGNIYAAEALFIAGLHPEKLAGELTQQESQQLVAAVKAVLKKAIKSGGTTLKDFSNHDGNPGYFTQKLQVYGRAGLPCYQCGKTLSLIRMGQRSTVFCRSCQKI